MTNALRFPAAVVERLKSGNDRVLVTGASGWLGQALLEMLGQALGPSLHDRVVCFGSAPRQLLIRGHRMKQHALADIDSLPVQCSVLFHLAYLTKEKAAGMSPGEYIAQNRSISERVARGAAEVGADRIFVSSSGAASQAEATGAGVESANAYGALKLEDETLFRQFAFDRANRRVLTVRLFNLSGPYINKLGSYALSSFIEQARRTGTIQINAAHRVVRSYTSVENFLAIAMSHLLDDSSQPWSLVETAGERTVEVGELAECVRALVGHSVVIRRPTLTGAPEDRYVGNAEAYRSLAARNGIVLHALERQVTDTFDYLVRAVPGGNTSAKE